jgi:type I restriction enzyme M protein
MKKDSLMLFDEDALASKDLKSTFVRIRDYFAGNVTGITRDEQIAQNLMRLLFCKMFDEQNNNDTFNKESINELEIEIQQLFDEVKSSYPDIFDHSEKIELKGRDLGYCVKELREFSLLSAERDVIGDAFEEFIGTAFRGGEGQFFTPRNIVEMMVEVLAPTASDRIIDPACGSGGFLAQTAKYLTRKNYQVENVFGLEKDRFLAKIAKVYVTLLSGNIAKVHCENSLDAPGNWNQVTQADIQLESYDVVLTNPPFGAKIPVIGESLLSQYKLAHTWAGSKAGFTSIILEKQSPQILFIERCMQLLKKGGRMGIVLPEGIFGNSSDKYVWDYLKSCASIYGVVSLAQEAFQPSTHTKTSVLFLEKGAAKRKSIFMASAEKVGHNKNGKLIYRIEKGKQVIDDDIPEITSSLKRILSGERAKLTRKCFTLEQKAIVDDIYIPGYYDPEVESQLNSFRKNPKFELLSIGSLLEKGIIEIRRGNEIGSDKYGSGNIPFIRTSDIVNWEIKADPIKSVSEDVYKEFAKQQDVKAGDILLVSDGTFLIGRSAMLGQDDAKIVIQSHVKKIRVLDDSYIDPYYLFYLLNSPIFKKQVQSKVFVQATISTLGNRLYEILLPILNEKRDQKKIAMKVADILSRKWQIRREISELTLTSVSEI